MSPDQTSSGAPRRARDDGGVPYRSGVTAGSAPRRARRAPRLDDERRGFGASLGYTLLGAIIPGAGLLRARFRWWGALMIAGALILVAAAVGTFLYARDWLISQAVTPASLTALWIALIVIAVVWVTSLVVTHLTLRPRDASAWQRVVGAIVVAILSFAVTAPTLLVARRAYDQADFVSDVFSTGPSATKSAQGNPFGDAWAGQPRLNVLVMGGDSGKGRSSYLGVRTDTVILASINTRTGDTVLYQIPRQTARMPFPPGSGLARVFPRGFTDGNPLNSDYFLNSMYDNAPKIAGPNILGYQVANESAEIVKISVGEALGLHVDYYALINMDGFVKLIDALGGVTVNVNQPVPMGGQKDPTRGVDIPPDRWLPVGPNQHLNGMDALWYARGRYGEETGNYARMARQQCLIRAVVQQANPTTVLTNYESLAKAGQNIIETDVPNHQLPALLQLALHVQRQGSQVESYQFQNEVDGFSTVRPDWELVHQRVQAALNPPAPSTETPGTPAPPETTAPAAPTTSPASVVTPTGTPSVVETPAASVDECAYHPTWQVTPAPTP